MANFEGYKPNNEFYKEFVRVSTPPTEAELIFSGSVIGFLCCLFLVIFFTCLHQCLNATDTVRQEWNENYPDRGEEQPGRIVSNGRRENGIPHGASSFANARPYGRENVTWAFHPPRNENGAGIMNLIDWTNHRLTSFEATPTTCITSGFSPSGCRRITSPQRPGFGDDDYSPPPSGQNDGFYVPSPSSYQYGNRSSRENYRNQDLVRFGVNSPSPSSYRPQQQSRLSPNSWADLGIPTTEWSYQNSGFLHNPVTGNDCHGRGDFFVCRPDSHSTSAGVRGLGLGLGLRQRSRQQFPREPPSFSFGNAATPTYRSGGGFASSTFN